MIALPFVRFLTEIKVSGLPPRSSFYFSPPFFSSPFSPLVPRSPSISSATRSRGARRLSRRKRVCRHSGRVSSVPPTAARARGRVDDERLRQCGIICSSVRESEEGERRDAAPLVANLVSPPGTYADRPSPWSEINSRIRVSPRAAYSEALRPIRLRFQIIRVSSTLRLVDSFKPVPYPIQQRDRLWWHTSLSLITCIFRGAWLA